MPPPGDGLIVYNPGLLTKPELVAGFLVRRAELDEILTLVRSAPSGAAPQHVLILGLRGMGKTTLLHRVAYAAQDDPVLSHVWLPLLFDEEQYNVGELADLWLNALSMLSVAVREADPRRVAEDLSRRYKGAALEEAACKALKEQAQRRGRRLLLLVDNVDAVLSRIDRDVETSRLREVLQQEPWIMLIGASSRAIEATFDYERPLYEMFRVIELRPLDDGETMALLDGLAKRFAADQVSRLVRENPRKMHALRLLMGGNPRTAALLFGMLRQGPEGDLRSHLEQLLDAHTSLYKERVESLPAQMQRVFDALAQRWDPATAEEIAQDLRIERSVASAQLHRLIDKGLVQKANVPGRTLGFQVRERFFNLWCLMRGRRRGRERLRWLVEFIKIFYEPERVDEEIRHLVETLGSHVQPTTVERRMEYAGALSTAVEDDKRAAQLYVSAFSAGCAAGRPDLAMMLDLDRLSNLARSRVLSDAEALDLVEAARRVGVEHLDLCLRHARILLGSYRFNEALEVAGRGTELGPSDPRGWGLLGEILGRLGRFDEAQRALERARDLAPNQARAWRSLGRLLIEAQRPTQALVLLNHASELQPEDASTLILLSVAHNETGDHASALRTAMRASDLDPQEATALAQALVAARKLGEQDVLHAVLESLPERLLRAKSGHYAVAQAFEETGGISRGQEVFRELVAQQPDAIEIQLGHAYLESWSGKPEAALEILKALEQKAPQDARVLDLLGRTYGILGMTDLALAKLSEARGKLPGDTGLALTHVLALCAAGNTEQAKAELEQLWNRSPLQGQSIRSLATTLARAGEMEKLETLLVHMVELHPENAELWTQLGVARGRRGRHGDAADALLRAVGVGASEPHVWGGLALALGLSGRSRELLAVEPPPAAGLPPVPSSAIGACLRAAGAHGRAEEYEAQGARGFARGLRESALPAGVFEESLVTLETIAGIEPVKRLVRSIAEIESQHGALWLLAAALETRSGQPGRAMELARRAIDAGAPVAAVDRMKLQALVALKLYQDAEPIARRVAAEEPTTELGSRLHAWILVNLDRREEALVVARSLPSIADEPRRQAALLVGLVQGDDAVSLEARSLLQRMLERAPIDLDVRLAACHADLRLGRIDSGVEHLAFVLDRATEQDLERLLKRLVGAMIRVARRGAPDRALAVLEKSPHGPSLAPILHALAIVSGQDPERLRRLSPELRALVEDVLADMRRSDTP